MSDVTKYCLFVQLKKQIGESSHLLNNDSDDAEIEIETLKLTKCFDTLCGLKTLKTYLMNTM